MPASGSQPSRPASKHVLVRRCGRFPGRLRVDKLDDYAKALEAFLDALGRDDDEPM